MSHQDYVPQLFSLKKMCGNCPFRADDGAIELAPGRLRSICDGLLEQDLAPFICHKFANGERTESEDGEEFQYVPDGEERYCVGAMAFLHRERRPNVPMRLGYAFGALKPAALDDVVPQIKPNDEID